MSPQLDRNERVLESLGEALKTELTAVYQYLLHSRVCRNWGYSKLAETNRKESLEEMEHATAIIDRILFLKGTPNMTDLAEIKECSDAKEQFENDLALETEAISRLNAAVKVATEAEDHVTRQLFDKILADEDHHLDYLRSEERRVGNTRI